MTIKEFNKTGFRNGMKIEYKGNIYDIISVDFEESLVGIEKIDCEGGDKEISWKRCENCKLIK